MILIYFRGDQFEGDRGGGRGLGGRLRTAVSAAVEVASADCASAIAVAFTAARALGPNSLSKQDGYRLEITAHRFFVNARLYLNDLFYTSYFYQPESGGSRGRWRGFSA